MVVLTIDNPSNIAEFFGLPLDEIEGPDLNDFQDQLNCDFRLYEELIRHVADGTRDLFQLKNHIGVVFTGNVRGYGFCLPQLEIVADFFRVGGHVQSHEFDQDIEPAEKIDYLCGLCLVEAASFYLNFLLGPFVPQAQELIEEFFFACGRHDERKDE